MFYCAKNIDEVGIMITDFEWCDQKNGIGVAGCGVKTVWCGHSTNAVIKAFVIGGCRHRCLTISENSVVWVRISWIIFFESNRIYFIFENRTN